MLLVPHTPQQPTQRCSPHPQATVIMKYLSQFGFLPWTTKRYAGINLEKPFSLPNILGIEKKDSFAMCDLFQLLVLFFHRTTMKVRPACVLGPVCTPQPRVPQPVSPWVPQSICSPNLCVPQPVCVPSTCIYAYVP